MALPDQLEHPAAQPGQARAAAGAEFRRPIQCGSDAGGMVVICDGRRRGHGCSIGDGARYSITGAVAATRERMPARDAAPIIDPRR
jgi:hypothetical protein